MALTRKDFIVAINRFKIIKVLRKNSSKIFGVFREGDILVARLDLNSAWRIGRIKEGDTSLTEIDLGTTTEGNFLNFIDPFFYNRAFELEPVEMDEFDYKNRVKKYCEDICLISGDEQTCACCPLKL